MKKFADNGVSKISDTGAVNLLFDECLPKLHKNEKNGVGWGFHTSPAYAESDNGQLDTSEVFVLNLILASLPTLC